MADTENHAPVFMICSERSGSNLMSSIMGAHPDVFAPPPYHLGRDLLLNLYRLQGKGVEAKVWQTLKTHAVGKVVQYGAEGDADRLRHWLDAQTEIDPVAIARFMWCEMPQGAQGKRVFVKENNAHRLVAFLSNAFPDAKFVFQVRDPRDYLASALARRKGPLGNKFGSVREALLIWREDQLGGLNALSLLGPDRVHLVRYEDITGAPEQHLPDLCAFLDMPYRAEMLDFHNSKRAENLAVSGGPRENLAKPLMSSNSRKYLKQLSKSQIRTVEAYCGDLMRLLGYNPEYGTSLLRSPWRAFWPMFCEPFERLRNRQVKPLYKVGHSRLTKAMTADLEPMRPWVYGEPGRD